MLLGKYEVQQKKYQEYTKGQKKKFLEVGFSGRTWTNTLEVSNF